MGDNRVAHLFRRRRRRDRSARRRILAYLASEPATREAVEIREFGPGLLRFAWPEVWGALRQLVDRGQVLFAYEEDRWERYGFRFSTRSPVFWHHKWSAPATPPGADGPDEGGEHGR